MLTNHQAIGLHKCLREIEEVAQVATSATVSHDNVDIRVHWNEEGKATIFNIVVDGKPRNGLVVLCQLHLNEYMGYEE